MKDKIKPEGSHYDIDEFRKEREWLKIQFGALKDKIKPEFYRIKLEDREGTFKIIIFGEESLGKTTLVNEYLTKMFDDDKKMITAGVDFYLKELEINGKKVLIQLWDLKGEERFRFLLPTYCLWADGAFILYDLTRAQTLDEIGEWVNIVHQNGGDIPIILVGILPDDKKDREVTEEEGKKIADSMKLSGYIECNLKTGQNIDKIFEVMTDLLLKPMKEYKINEFLSLRLERGRGFQIYVTQIYVKGERFLQCKRLVLNISKKDVPIYDEINSIDEAADVYQKHLYQNKVVEGPLARDLHEDHDITPEQEFWGHCSNLQVWYENDYDTRLLHSNLAFYLLKALVDAGDPIARRVFKNEVAERFGSGYPNTIISLLNANLLDYFSLEEKRELILPNVPVILKISPHLFENGFISSDDPLLEEAKEGLVRLLRELGEVGPGVSRKLELEESKKVEEGRKEEEEKAVIISGKDISMSIPEGKDITKPEASHYDVLLVDDDLAALKLLTMYFESKDITCRGVVNGTKALEELESNTPKLIITDIIHPAPDGFDLCKQIKSNPKLKHIPVFFCSVYFTSFGSKIAKYLAETKADGYIPKPFAFSDLDVILNLLHRQKNKNEKE